MVAVNFNNLGDWFASKAHVIVTKILFGLFLEDYVYPRFRKYSRLYSERMERD